MSELAAWHARARLKAAVRAFFEARGYLELDTPIAVVCPGTEVHLQYFETTWRDHRGTAHELYLRSSPELHLKQAIAAGAPRVFQLAPCFRNGGELADWHQPEFTMLEFYETGRGYDAFIDLTEELLRTTRQAVPGARPLPARFRRIPVAEAFREFASLTLEDLDPDLPAQARAAGLASVRRDDDFETAFFKVLLDRVEPALKALGGAVLTDYPASQAALARVEGGVAKRFEFYLDGIELCNGFLELLDEPSNRERISANNLKRSQLGHRVPPEDEDFYAALARGLPACSGNALGFDRWLAWLLGDSSLDRAVPFRRSGPFRQAP